MSNRVWKAKVKATGEVVEVYKLENGKYNVYLGDKISVDKIDKKEHMKTFDADEIVLSQSS